MISRLRWIYQKRLPIPTCLDLSLLDFSYLAALRPSPSPVRQFQYAIFPKSCARRFLLATPEHFHDIILRAYNRPPRRLPDIRRRYVRFNPTSDRNLGKNLL